MSGESVNSNQPTPTSGKGLAIAVLSLLYTVMNNLTEDLSLFGYLEDTVTVGIFVPASAALIFGRGIGGASGGIGEILLDIQGILSGGEGIDSINLGTLISAGSISLGAWLTGFLGKENTKEESPETFGDVFKSLKQWKKVGTDVVASIVGLGITKNFLYAYGSQIQEGASIAGGTPLFLQLFMSDTLALIAILPFTLIGFDLVQVFFKTRDRILEQLLLDIDKTVDIEECVKINDVTLPNGILVQGKWTLVKITFRNIMESKMAFHLDAVATSRMYPDQDTTGEMKPGSVWVQSFYILPSKQKSVNLRVRITPKSAEEYKSKETKQTVVEINAQTKDPSNMTASLLGFSGINFGVVGISAAWDNIIEIVTNPQELFGQLADQADFIVATLIAETLLLVPVLLLMYRRYKNPLEGDSLRLGFTRGFDYQSVQTTALGFFGRFREKYEGRLKTVFLSLIGLASVAGVGYLGFEAYNILTNPDYIIQNPNLIFGLAIGLLGLWLFGVRGADLVKAIGIGDDSPWEFSRDNTITVFKPLTQLQINTPTEVLIKAHNVTDKPGIRIVFQGFDSISPQSVELHLDPGESTEFKIAITPLKKEVQDILAICYPLFDYDKKYIDPNVAEPFDQQEIQYEVLGQTSLGITKSQQDQLKKGLGAGGFLALAYSFISTLDFVNVPTDFDQFIEENGVIFSALQTPFLYVYFYFNNKFKSGN